MSHSVTFAHIRSHSRNIRLPGGAKYLGISRSELSRTLTFSATDSALYNIKGEENGYAWRLWHCGGRMGGGGGERLKVASRSLRLVEF